MNNIIVIGFIIILITVPISLMAQTTPVDKNIQLLKEKVSDMEKELSISKEYFGYVLMVMTTIILVLIALFLAIQWGLLIKSLQADLDKRIRETKEELTKEFSTLKDSHQKSTKELEDRLNTMSNQSIENVKDHMADAIKQLDKENKQTIDKIQANANREITRLRGEIYRTFASHWKSQQAFETAFLWWVRCANEFSQVNESNLTKIALSSAIECLQQPAPMRLAAEYDTEVLRLFVKIKERDAVYRMDAEQIEKLYKEKKFPPTLGAAPHSGKS